MPSVRIEPHAIDKVPRPFVAEHDLLRVGRRALQVVEPVVAAVNHFRLAAGDVDRVQHHGQAGGPPAQSSLSNGRRAASRGSALPSRIDRRRHNQRFIGIDGDVAAAEICPAARRHGALRAVSSFAA